MKKCSNPECHLGDELQDMEKFSGDSSKKDLKRTRCRVCTNAVQNIRNATPEAKAKIADRTRLRRLDPVKRAHDARVKSVYQKTEAGKAVAKKSQSKRYLNSPEQVKAVSSVGHAITAGRLTRPDVCSCCGKHKSEVGMIQGHHADYSKPLEVKWLCKGCHTDWHLLHEYLGAPLMVFRRLADVKAEAAVQRGRYP